MQRIHRAFVNHPIALAATFLAMAGMLVYGVPDLMPPLRAEKTAAEKVLPAPAVNKDVEVLRDISTLPPQVARMRGAILSAAATGEVENLRVPIDMNELPPMLAAEKIKDPMAYWREISGDGQGREVMATLIQLFRTGFARKGAGTENELYVWPYFVGKPLSDLTPPERVELLRIVTAGDLMGMEESGNYNFYRIGISPDGEWKFMAGGD